MLRSLVGPARFELATSTMSSLRPLFGAYQKRGFMQCVGAVSYNFAYGLAMV